MDEDITTGLIVFVMLNNVKATQKKKDVLKEQRTLQNVGYI